MSTQKTVIAINDISCMGRCSLTVALPILSACGVETAIIPTAVLSTHTGGFTGFTFRSLSEDILPVAKHWKTLGRKYAGIYTGFFCDEKQIKDSIKVYKMLADDDTVFVVDPVMGDAGMLYKCFDDSIIKGMRKIVRHASVITPNITEACLLTGVKYPEGIISKKKIDSVMNGLKKLTDGSIVLTGLNIAEGKLGTLVYDCKTGSEDMIENDLVEGQFHGAGDVFASALTGRLINGDSLYDASALAADYTYRSIAATAANKTEPRYGLCFELCTDMLVTGK